MPPIDRSKEEIVSTFWASMLLIVFSPVLVPLAILSTPYLAYRGIKAVSKKCMTNPPEEIQESV